MTHIELISVLEHKWPMGRGLIGVIVLLIISWIGKADTILPLIANIATISVAIVTLIINRKKIRIAFKEIFKRNKRGNTK